MAKPIPPAPLARAEDPRDLPVDVRPKPRPATGAPFAPGQSGNPLGSRGRAGRPRLPQTYRERILQSTRDGAELVNFYLAVMRGEIGCQVECGRDEQTAPGRITYKLVYPTMIERLRAADQLALRAWGQPRQEIAIGPLEQRAQELSALPPEELEAAIRKALGQLGELPAANDAPNEPQDPNMEKPQ